MPPRRIKARWSAFTDFYKNGCRWKYQDDGRKSRPYVWNFQAISTGEHLEEPEYFDPKKSIF